jgi:hypothetical protein
MFGPLIATLFLSLVIVGSAQAAPPSAPTKIDIDLSKPFGTRSSWHFIASQKPSVPEPVDASDFTYPGEPGLVHLCLRPSPTASCDPLVSMPQPPAPVPPDSWEPHYLNHAQVVYSAGNATPVFLLQKGANIVPMAIRQSLLRCSRMIGATIDSNKSTRMSSAAITTRKIASSRQVRFKAA